MNELKSQMAARIAYNFGFLFPRGSLAEFETGETMTVEIDVDGRITKTFVPIIGMQIKQIDLKVVGVEMEDESLIVIQSQQSTPSSIQLQQIDSKVNAIHQIWNMDRWIGSDIQTTALALYGSELMIHQGLSFIPFKDKELLEYLKKL